MTNLKSTATARLKQDYIRLKKDPVPYIDAEYLPSNILEFHYVIRGPEDSPYKDGFYHGALMFTKEFPFKPPSIYMFTPNGRFKTNKRLCLSISDFHPDTWNPAWSISTILTGLLSFMLETTPTLGSCESTLKEKRKFAENSLEFNMKNETFCELFPDFVAEMKDRLAKRESVNTSSTPGGNGVAGSKENRTEGTAGGGGGGGGVGGAAAVAAAAEDAVADNHNTSPWHSFTTNIIFILLFLIFALIVNHVLKTMNIE